MNPRITLSTALLLTVPPVLWAGNAVVGRLVHEWVPPMTLNLLRWAIALVILLPLAGSILRRGSGLWTCWRRFTVLGLLGIGLYNSLQYLALQSSSPINVTLVAASMPVWMLLVGGLFFGAKVRRKQVIGAVLSIAGVLLVLSRGEWRQLLAMHSGARRSFHDRSDHRMVLLQLVVDAAARAEGAPQRLGGLSAGASRVRRDVVRRICRRRMGGQRSAHRLELALGGGTAVRRCRTGNHRLSLLGYRGTARGASHCGLLQQSDPSFCGNDVIGIFR